LWALEDYRELSYRLAMPLLMPLARAAFATLSMRRHDLAKWLFAREQDLADALAKAPPPETCDDDRCAG
jgi:hypothetical protein